MKDIVMTEDVNAPLADKTDTAANHADNAADAQAPDTTAQAVKGLIEQHPVAALAGGILIGALIASALPRRKPDSAAKVAASTFGKQASRLAGIGAQLATAYAARAMQAGRDGSEKLEDLGEIISETSGEAKRRTSEMADVAATAVRELSAVALRHAGEIAARLKR
jgi:hypothetical protein